MTNEEKEAIEFLKGVCTDDCVSRQYIVEPILNLIEKQSKEIEELKKPKHIINFETNEITKLTNEFINKDKIKPILKKYGKKDIWYAPDFYKEIQSLLEEE